MISGIAGQLGSGFVQIQAVAPGQTRAPPSRVANHRPRDPRPGDYRNVDHRANLGLGPQSARWKAIGLRDQRGVPRVHRGVGRRGLIGADKGTGQNRAVRKRIDRHQDARASRRGLLFQHLNADLLAYTNRHGLRRDQEICRAIANAECFPVGADPGGRTA